MKFVKVITYRCLEHDFEKDPEIMLIPLKEITKVRFEERKVTFYKRTEVVDGEVVGFEPYVEKCEFTIVETSDDWYECYTSDDIAPTLDECIVYI